MDRSRRGRNRLRRRSCRRRGSPVRVDSSTLSDTASSNSPSAGTVSPLSTTTMSPTTTSHRGMLHIVLLRSTLTGTSSLTLFSRRKRRRASHSNQKLTHVASTMAPMMPIDSVKSPCRAPIASESTAATSRMRIMGSRNFSAKSSHAEWSRAGVMRLAPCRRRLAVTSSGVRPCGACGIIVCGGVRICRWRTAVSRRRVVWR